MRPACTSCRSLSPAAATCRTAAARRVKAPPIGSMRTASSRGWRCSRLRSSSSAPRTASTARRRPSWRPWPAESLEACGASRMTLELLFVVDPLDELKAYKDSSVAMMREAAGRGHAIFAATPDELAATHSAVTARAHRLQLTQSDDDWHVELGAEERDLASFSAVLMRKDPPFDVEFLN